tara:strand:- start:4010 stop:4861 length:852 start_codon:yes stop_codon:yes gene_type:complete
MKYLIYKGTGGLVHMLNGLQAAIELAKKEQRHLIIDTKRTSSFRKKFSDYFFIWDKELDYQTDYSNINESDDLYFEDIPILEIEEHGTKLIDGKYYLSDSTILLQNLNGMKNKQVRVYAGYNHNYIENLRIKTDILYEIFDDSIEMIEQYKPYISVHFRNTDMKNSINDFIKKIRKTSKKYKTKNIFIATDDFFAFDSFKEFLPKLNFFKICTIPNCNGKNMHYHFQDKDLLIKNTLKDLYMIIKSNYFIPSINSGISKWLIHQQNDIENQLFDDDYNFEVIP